MIKCYVMIITIRNWSSCLVRNLVIKVTNNMERFFVVYLEKLIHKIFENV
jgi:hypothetical protein